MISKSQRSTLGTLELWLLRYLNDLLMKLNIKIQRCDREWKWMENVAAYITTKIWRPKVAGCQA